MDYAFYHLTASPLEKALPRLMEKVAASGLRAVVLCPDDTAMETLNTALWTYSPNTFLPHGSRLDPRPDEQPIYLTSRMENPNGAGVLALTGGLEPDIPGEYSRVLDLFDAADPAQLDAARARWKRRKEQGHALAYWRQNDEGGWVKEG